MIVVNYTRFSSQSVCCHKRLVRTPSCRCIPCLCFPWCRLLRPSGWTDRHLLACIECRLMNVFMCYLSLFFSRLIPVHRHLIHNVPANCYKPAGSQVLAAEVFKTHFCERKDFEKRVYFALCLIFTCCHCWLEEELIVGNLFSCFSTAGFFLPTVHVKVRV